MRQSLAHIAESGKGVADSEKKSVWERVSGKEDVEEFYEVKCIKGIWKKIEGIKLALLWKDVLEWRVTMVKLRRKKTKWLP